MATAPSKDWKVSAVGDATGDGVPDIVLQNESAGVAVVWQIRELQVVGQSEAVAVPRGAKVVAADAIGVVLATESNGSVQLSVIDGRKP